jgi:hypothetical protein
MEYRPLRLHIRVRADKTPEEIGGLFPQRTVAPLVTFPMQTHMGRAIKSELLNAQVSNLLHPSAGIVKKQQQRTVA